MTAAQVYDTYTYLDDAGRRQAAKVVAIAPGASGTAPIDGDLTVFPASATNGAALSRPAGASGVIFYLAAGESITYAIATNQPGAAPAVTTSVDGNSYKQWSEPLGPGTNIYLTAKTGAPKYRFV